VHIPLGDDERPRSVTVEEAVAVQFSRARDAFEGRVAVGAQVYEPAMDGVDGVQSYTVGLLGSWFRELSPMWGAGASAGATALVGDTEALEPQARASLMYERERTRFNAEAAQALRANPLLGETLSTTSATVGLNLRFGHEDSFGFNVTGGASHARNVGDAPDRTINTAQGTAQLAWGPRENFVVTLTYELLYQVTDDATIGDSKLLRNAALAGLTAYWPTVQQRSRPVGIRLRVRQSEERDLELQERSGRLPE
jgi:hypothetical protein